MQKLKIYQILSVLLFLFYSAINVYGQQIGEKLSGTPIGSPNIDYDTNKSSSTVNTPAHAFDGNYDTFYASMDRSRTWVGLDLGTAHVITKVGWSPRTSQTSRVQLGLFEGSNSPDFLDAVPLYLIPSTGTAKVMDYADVPVTRGFRYVRYVGPNDARCNIAELEFYGYEGEGKDSVWYQITDLPTVSIHTEAGYDPKDKVTEMPSFITITYDGGTRIQEYPITARGRGNASWGFPKKPWRIKFNDGKSHYMLKGSPQESPSKAKKWTLINNYGDKTLMRNCLAFEISKRLNALYTPYCQPVDVIMNGEYKGCYQLCDQISVDKNRVPVTEMEPWDNEEPELTGGYLIEVDAYANQEISWFKSNRGNPVTIKHPGDDDITTQQHNYIYSYFNLMESTLFSSNYTDPESGYRKYLDAESFLKHFIIGEFSGNMDTYWSTYMYKEREESQFHVAPSWDFDLAFDNDQRIYPVNGRSDWAYLGGSAAGNMKSFVSRVLNDKATDQQLKQIWTDNRKEGRLDATTLVAYVDSMAQAMDASAQLNFIRWPILNSRVHQNVSALGSFDAEVDVLRNYIPARIAWIDKYLNYQAGPVYKDSTYYISNAEELMAFANAVNSGANGSDAYLTADIDMAQFSSSYTPIGTESKPYKGTFDGRKFRIKNMNIVGGDGFGVFGTVTGGATIKNLILDGSSSITGGAFVGVIGVSTGSGLVTVSCVGNEADITGSAQNAAGIIGCNKGSSCEFFLTDCYNTGSISGGNESASICGWIGGGGIMQNCWNIGTVSGYDWGHDMVRGSTVLENCYSTFGDQVTAIAMEQVTSGELCYNLNGGASEDINWYQTIGTDTHPVFDNTHGTVFKAADGTYYIEFNIKGDVNEDKKVDEADIAAMADYILNPVDEGFPFKLADMNNDGVIDVYDIVALRNYIDENPQHEELFTARLYAANTTIKAGGTRKVSVTLSAAQTATAWQADLNFGSLLSAKQESVQLGSIRSGSHIIRTSQTKDGLRILAYSPTQEPLSGRTGVAFYFVMDADSTFSAASDFTLSNIRVAAPDGSHAQINDATYTVSFAKTYVSSIVFSEPDVDIIQGSQVTLTPTVLPVLATNKELTWSTSDASIASVDQQGNVVSGSMGDAVITATATDGSRISGSVNVHVIEDPEVAVLSLHALPADAEVYDLSGRRINSQLSTFNSQLKKGVYIVNGKKVLVK
ncbi:MAG: CotH kinase family protein [Bacteroidaceae bacterium]|nr:CotH kinase family protein [Bacteroidaceae bacterium]